MDEELKKYKEVYVPMLKTYAKELLEHNDADAYKGIPSIFLPSYGVNYFKSDLRIAFVGMETYGWGDMSDFLKEAQKGDVSYAYDMSEFQGLKFVDWGSHRYTFWGFNLFFLGALYGLKDWELLKKREHAEILKSIAWGNASSVERFGNLKNVPNAVWEIAKKKSRDFDDITLLQKVLKPNAVLLLCGGNEGKSYLRNCGDAGKKPIFKSQRLNVYKIDEMYVFHAYHPNYMKFSGGAAEYAAEIREKMIEYKVFKQLPSFAKDDTFTEESICKTLREEFPIPRPVTFDVVLHLALMLRKQEAVMAVSMLTRILNKLGCKTNWNEEYAGGRGVFHMLSCFYNRTGLKKEEKEAIAGSFVNEQGLYPYD